MAEAQDNVVADEPKTFVEMLLASGESGDIKWFSYRPTYFGDIIRIEWDKDTMIVDIPSDYAGYLVSHGYARKLTDEEIEAYTAPAEKVEEPETVKEPALTTPAPAPTPAPKSTKKGGSS